MEYIQKMVMRWVIAESFGFFKQGACLNHDVVEPCQPKGAFIEIETLRHQQSILPRNNGETHLHLSSAEVSLSESTNHLTRTWVELKMLHTTGSWVVRTASVENQEASGETNTAPHCFYNPNQDVRMTMQGDFECFVGWTMDSSASILISKGRSERTGKITWIQRFKLEQSCDVELWSLNQDATLV